MWLLAMCRSSACSGGSTPLVRKAQTSAKAKIVEGLHRDDILVLLKVCGTLPFQFGTLEDDLNSSALDIKVNQ